MPNVVTLITGESLHTSWWSHPQSHRIFATLSELADDTDVLFAKVIHGKETLVHRRLWPALLAAASAREAWQVHGLSVAERRLLDAVDASDEPIRGGGPPGKALERRLLVRAEEVHTASGRHESALESWSSWQRRTRTEPAASAHTGKRAIEAAARALGVSLSALPWSSASK